MQDFGEILINKQRQTNICSHRNRNLNFTHFIIYIPVTDLQKSTLEVLLGENALAC